MDEDGALFDARFDDGEPFRDTPESGGISLESALRDFGPAALDDLIPRVRALARQLDAAHTAGVVHGALHPNRVIVYDHDTTLIKAAARPESAHRGPYASPEVVAGDAATPASDQYSLAAITYEWMFGRPISGPAQRPVEITTVPGADRIALSEAFSRALAREPQQRFASCEAFCDGLAAAVVPELPLLDDDGADPVGPFVPEEVSAPVHDDPWLTEEPAGPDAQGLASESFDSKRDDALAAQPPDFDAIDQAVPVTATPVANWNPPPAPVNEPARFGGIALIVAALVGAVFGFAAGYMAKPRALQSAPPETFATQPGTDSTVANPKSEDAPAPVAPPAPEAPLAPKAPLAPQAPVTPATGRLLVRSSPNGATVAVDGVEKGVTPLALRDLDFGTHTVTVSRSGFAPQSNRVALSASRPSRSLDVRLTAQSASPATAKPTQASSTGSLIVESRPVGATVTVNGKVIGTTPLQINLPPGEYPVVMTMQGFRNFTTSVRVVAGQRVRAAASLTAQEQE